jgi:hypothetical protein
MSSQALSNLNDTLLREEQTRIPFAFRKLGGFYITAALGFVSQLGGAQALSIRCPDGCVTGHADRFNFTFRYELPIRSRRWLTLLMRVHHPIAPYKDLGSNQSRHETGFCTVKFRQGDGFSRLPQSRAAKTLQQWEVIAPSTRTTFC